VFPAVGVKIPDEHGTGKSARSGSADHVGEFFGVCEPVEAREPTAPNQTAGYSDSRPCFE
jgi:hypothetical protein